MMLYMHTVSIASEALLPPHLQTQVWRGHRAGPHRMPVWASGHSTLDAELPGGGWPLHNLVEVLQPAAGGPVWALLTPALHPWLAQGRPLLLINPPHPPGLVGLHQLGVPVASVWWVQTQDTAQALWATEQALKAAVAATVLSWAPGIADPTALRRLQVAASSHHPGLLFLMRPETAASTPSPAPLRLLLGADPIRAEPRVRILKRRGGGASDPIALSSRELPGRDRLTGGSVPARPPLAVRAQPLQGGVPSDGPLDRVGAL